MKFGVGVWLATLVWLGADSAAAQTRIVTGRVTDSLSAQVVNAGQVSVQGSTVGTTINDDGTFTLVVPTRDVMLSIRSIGFRRKEVSVPLSQSSVLVALQRDYFQLEALVVTGQATGIERKNLAHAVATVSADQLTQAPAASVEQTLSGKIAGAQISTNSGAPGGGVLVKLRGVTSIFGGFSPLYVVDGVTVSDVAIPTGTNPVTNASGNQAATGAGQTNPVNRISDLNPEDIENVEVLKGAAASAIYGSKASNGVILITTKKGRVGAPQFTLTQRFGTSRLSKKPGARVFTNAADAVTAFGAQAAADFSAAGGKVFDHDQELAGGKPLSFETALAVNGGTETTRYYVSGLVKHDGGIIGRTFYDKQSLRLNVDQTIANRITLSLGSDVLHTASDRGLVNNDNAATSYYGALFTTPTFVDLRAVCPDGSRKVRCKDGVYPINAYASSNPLQTAELLDNKELVWRMITNGRLSIEAIATPQHTLRLIGNGGVDFFSQRNVVFSPPDLQFEPTDGLLGTSVLSYSQNLNLNANGNLVYAYRPSAGTSATTSLGVQYETRELAVDRTLGRNLVGGLQIPSSATNIGVDNQKQRVRDLGLFGQLELLTLAERLLVTAGVRADQSSNNGDPTELFYYPKASASFRFPGLVPGLVEELKLRAAYGQSGNQPLWAQKFTALSGRNVIGLAAFSLGGSSGALDLRPERQREIEGGLDATLFGSRLGLEVTAYEKRITELLLRRTLVPSEGFGTLIFNGGVLRTRGLEAALNANLARSSAFDWSVRGTFFTTRSKIVELPVPTFRIGGAQFGAYQIEAGKSATQIIGNDSMPDGTRIVRAIADAAPDFKVSLSNDLTYKSFRFYMLWDGSQGGRLWNTTQWLCDLALNCEDSGDRQPDGRLLAEKRLAEYPKSSLVYLHDISYVKLREARISLDVPRSVVQRVWSGARNVRLSLSGRELLTFTPYPTGDPEVSQVPGTLGAGVPWDLWTYPPSRSFWLSIDLGF